MSIFRVEVEKVVREEVLVMANDKDQARLIVNKALNTGEIDFNDDCVADINSIRQIEQDTKIDDEISDYGILNYDSEFVYDAKFDEDAEKLRLKREKEEYLKKYHLELGLYK